MANFSVYIKTKLIDKHGRRIDYRFDWNADTQELINHTLRDGIMHCRKAQTCFFGGAGYRTVAEVQAHIWRSMAHKLKTMAYSVSKGLT